MCRWGSGHRAFPFDLIQFVKGEASLGAGIRTASHQAFLHFTSSHPLILSSFPSSFPLSSPSSFPSPLHRTLPFLLLHPLGFLIRTPC